MTRTDVIAAGRRGMLLVVAAVFLGLALLTPGVALAETTTTNKEGLSGYGKEEAKKEEPKAGKEPSPSKEAASPKEPAKEPASTSPEAKAATLPFTGLDLRWVVVIGVLMVGSGFAIVSVQRRQRRHDRR